MRVSLDYDFKREPVDLVEIDGHLNFATRPWPDLDAFKAARTIWTAGSTAGSRCSRHGPTGSTSRHGAAVRRCGRRETARPASRHGSSPGRRRRPGFPVRIGRGRVKSDEPTLDEVAAILTKAGVPDVTRDILMNARRRAPDPIGSVAVMTETDTKIRRLLRAHLSDEALDSVLSRKPEKRR